MCMCMHTQSMSSDNTKDETLVLSSWEDVRQAIRTGDHSKRRKVIGCVSYRDAESWSVAPNIRVCDAEGDDVAVFFLVKLDEQNALNDVHIGDVVSVREPHIRPFADGQEGVPIDDSQNVALISTQSLTDTRRLQFVELHKKKGDWWTQRQRWELARMNYANGLDLLQYSSPSAAAHGRARSLRVQLHVHMCECLFELKRWRTLIQTSESALPFIADVKADPSICSPRAYTMFFFALARAHEEIRDYEMAYTYSRQATMLEPLNRTIMSYHMDMQRCRDEKNVALSSLMRNVAKQSLLRGMHSSFGFRSAVLLGNSATELDSVRYLIDLHTLYHAMDKRACMRAHLRRHLLYVMSSTNELSLQDLSTLHSELGIKTYICVQYAHRDTVVPYTNLKLMTDAAAVSVQRRADRAERKHRIWNLFYTGSDVSCAFNKDAQAVLRGRSDGGEKSGGTSVDLCGLMPMDKPAVITFHVPQLSIPRWLYHIWSVLSVLHLIWLCDIMIKLWFYFSARATSYELDYGLTDVDAQLLFRLLSDPSNYPIVVISDSNVQQAELLLVLLDTLANANTDKETASGWDSCDDRLSTIAETLDLSEAELATVQHRARSCTRRTPLLRLETYAKPVIDLLSAK